jgi:uncharacterized protein (DUF58 family)
MLRTTNPTRPRSIDQLLDSAMMARLGQLDLTSRKMFAGKLKGERRSKKRGESVEFADHRQYNVGDDLRHIDWNIYGRLDRFFMKLFVEEEDLSLHLVIDASESSDCGEPNKFFYMQQVALALGYIGLVNLNRVAVTTIGGTMRTGEEDAESRVAGGDEVSPMHTIRDLRGKRRLHDLGRFLCAIEPGGRSDFAEVAKRIALSRRGRGVMVVLSDYFMKEGYETGLRLLVGRGYDLFALQILSPQEVEPDIKGDLRLRDVEDGDMAEVTISAPLLKKYKQILASYCTELREFCARREITSFTIRSDTPVDSLVLDYLRRRGLLR